MIRISARTISERPCEQCYQLFVPMKGSAGRFCSRACSGAFRTANLERFPCAQCGKVIEHRVFQNLGYKNYFCGKECHSAFMKGSGAPIAERFWKYVAKSDDPNGCWLWTAHRDHKGYGRMTCRSDRGRKIPLVHRISWELHHGPIPDGMGVLHRCDNPPCCNPDHLFLGTAMDNTQDCITKDRFPRGERVSGAKMTEEKVIEMRRRFAEGETNISALARDFGICRQTATRIVRGENWAHIPFAAKSQGQYT